MRAKHKKTMPHHKKTQSGYPKRNPERRYRALRILLQAKEVGLLLTQDQTTLFLRNPHTAFSSRVVLRRLDIEARKASRAHNNIIRNFSPQYKDILHYKKGFWTVSQEFQKLAKVVETDRKEREIKLSHFLAGLFVVPASAYALSSELFSHQSTHVALCLLTMVEGMIVVFQYPLEVALDGKNKNNMLKNGMKKTQENRKPLPQLQNHLVIPKRTNHCGRKGTTRHPKHGRN